jgi:GNAT superfamily N-acetyltransferase
MVEIREIDTVVAEAVLGKGKEGVRVESNAVAYGVYDGDQLQAICSLEVRGTLAVLSMDYVLPEFRKRGHHRQMIAFRVRTAAAQGCTVAQATCLKSSVDNYMKAGFAIVHQYLNGWKVRRPLKEQDAHAS